MYSVDVRGRAWRIVQNAGQWGPRQSWSEFQGRMISRWCNQAKIISENSRHNFAITFYHTGWGIGSFFSRAQGESRYITPKSRFQVITLRGIIGDKIKTFHSFCNQPYSLHSWANDCTWGATESNRSDRRRSFIRVTRLLNPTPPGYRIQVWVVCFSAGHLAYVLHKEYQKSSSSTLLFRMSK